MKCIHHPLTIIQSRLTICSLSIALVLSAARAALACDSCLVDHCAQNCPLAPPTCTAVPAVICPGGTSRLTAALGAGGDTVEWFTGSCGGTYVGTGTPLYVTPAGTTTYYARTGYSCTNDTCECTSNECCAVTVTVGLGAPTDCQADPARICGGEFSTLTATPGAGGDTIAWFAGSCNEAPVGMGTALVVSPGSTTTYYARTGYSCTNDTCECTSDACCQATVSVNPPSTIAYTVEVGGDNHRLEYENGQTPQFTGGSTSTVLVPPGATSVTWDVRVSASGEADVPDGHGGTIRVPIFGAANLAWDLELYDSANQLVTFGAALLACDSGTLGIDCLNAHPTTAGFYSSINDGDKDGTRGALIGADPKELAAFAYSFRVSGADPWARVVDAPGPANRVNGPDLAMKAYPSDSSGKLTGMSAGYEQFKSELMGGDQRAGVGLSVGSCYLGTGPVAEGQISLTGLPPGTYTLKVVPGAGNQVLAFADFCDVGTDGQFAFPACTVRGSSVDFVIQGAPPPVVDTFAINNGAASTTSLIVTLNNTCSGGPTEYMASESSSFTDASWQAYPTTAPSFTLSAAGGLKTVYFKVHNAVGQESAVVTDTIVLAYVVESRNGGQNFGNYSDGGIPAWANSGIKSGAGGCTPGIGSRSATTYRSVAGERHAIFRAALSVTGYYEVSTTWGAGSARRSPILHRITHGGGTTDIDVDQAATQNAWVSLGVFPFLAGTDAGQVDVSNLHINTSGTMYADAIKWEYAGPSTPPEPPSECQAVPATIRGGESSTLSATPGAGGDAVEWFTGNCGDITVPGGASPVVSPTTTTTYYGRTKDLSTGFTSATCCEVTVVVNDALPNVTSIAPALGARGQTLTGVTISGANFLSGATAKLSRTGQMDIPATNVAVAPDGLSLTCDLAIPGGAAVGLWDVVVTTGGQSGTLPGGFRICDALPVAPTGVTLSPSSSVCAGTSVTLTATGGSGGTLTWYAGGCGSGSPVGTGSPLNINAPATTTTYYVRVESDCGVSECRSANLTVTPQPSLPTDVTATSAYTGAPMTLTAGGGSGATLEWYADACGVGAGGLYVGRGSSIHVTPSGTTTYYVREEGGCGNSSCASVVARVMACAAQPNWTSRGNIGVASSYSAMVYDSGRGVTVFFGGYLHNQTWEYNGTWTRRYPAHAPPARGNHAMAYDSIRGKTVLFGGDVTGNYADVNDTWEWDGTDWTQLTPQHSPPAREGHVMAYDSRRQHCVIFSGRCAPSYPNDTWEWDGTDWTQRSSANGTAPRSRNYSALAYDSQRGVCVLFGGWASPLSAETWEWDGTNWTQKSPALRPPARQAHNMAYDSGRGVVVLFGGYYYDGVDHWLADTWEYNGVNWRQRLPASSPPGHDHHCMAYDSARHRSIVLGGDCPGNEPSVTWELQDPSAPTPSSVRADFDGDCDVDDVDLAAFVACGTKAAQAPPAGCTSKDLDNDNDVDQEDFGLFQRCLSGADTPANPSCSN